MPRFQFQRESRTPHSESYLVFADDNPIGKADIHFGNDIVNATLCVPDDFSEDDIQALIGEVDERLVMTAMPFRDDFVVTVWLGRRAGVYSEETPDEATAAAAEAAEGNGQKGEIHLQEIPEAAEGTGQQD